MAKQSPVREWREVRREAARATLLAAAWALVREDGLAALTLRGLAERAGVSTPTVYAYFENKNAIFDAMFAEAAEAFLADKTAPAEVKDPVEMVRLNVQRFVHFCTCDVPRYQLLFQHSIPGFEPSPSSYAPAVQALAHTKSVLAEAGAADGRHVDLFTAMTTGLVDQQISNEPGGRRWVRLVDEAVDMFVAYCAATRPTARESTRRRKS